MNILWTQALQATERTRSNADSCLGSISFLLRREVGRLASLISCLKKQCSIAEKMLQRKICVPHFWRQITSIKKVEAQIRMAPFLCSRPDLYVQSEPTARHSLVGDTHRS